MNHKVLNRTHSTWKTLTRIVLHAEIEYAKLNDLQHKHGARQGWAKSKLARALAEDSKTSTDPHYPLALHEDSITTLAHYAVYRSNRKKQPQSIVDQLAILDFLATLEHHTTPFRKDAGLDTEHPATLAYKHARHALRGITDTTYPLRDDYVRRFVVLLDKAQHYARQHDPLAEQFPHDKQHTLERATIYFTAKLSSPDTPTHSLAQTLREQFRAHFSETKPFEQTAQRITQQTHLPLAIIHASLTENGDYQLYLLDPDTQRPYQATIPRSQLEADLHYHFHDQTIGPLDLDELHHEGGTNI